MPSVYRKTDKGRQEIATRASGLAPRLRSALILVDGKRDDATLARLLHPDGIGCLQALAAGGFVEAIDTPAAAAPIPAARAGTGASGFAEQRRAAVRALVDQIGPHADDLAMRMEKAPDPAALGELVELACRRVEMLRGKDAARAYGDRFGSMG